MSAAKNHTPNDNHKSLTYGLNPRKKRKTVKGLTGFDDDTDDDDDDGHDEPSHPPTGKSVINRDIAREQAALRKRAQTAMTKLDDDTARVYDYDAHYESFASGLSSSSNAAGHADGRHSSRGSGDADNGDDRPKPKQSRYITNLLKHAERRTKEQEIIYERKVAKEQAIEEETQGELYAGKEKFITSSYKKKLAEREEWARKEEEKAKREEEEDVAVRARKEGKKGSFLYGGGFARNVVLGALGGGGGKKEEERCGGDLPDERGDGHENYGTQKDRDDVERHSSTKIMEYEHRDSSRETERWGSSRRNMEFRDNYPRRHYEDHDNDSYQKMNGNEKVADEAVTKVRTRDEILAERAVKLREARKRYFERRGGNPPTQ